MIVVFVQILALCLLLFSVNYSKYYPRILVKVIFVAWIVALAGIGICIDPKESYDLYRHYELINRVRQSSYSLSFFLSQGCKNLNANYQYTYVFNILIYLIARFFPNQALPFLTIIVTYSVFVYILLTEFKKNLTNRDIVLSMALFTVLMPYLYVYSGIRNALAGAIVSIGIYRLYRFKKVVAFIICTIIAILIHPIAAAVVPFITLSRMKPRLLGFIVTIVAPSLVSQVMEFLRHQVDNNFLFRIAVKYYNYTRVRVDNQGMVFLLSPIIILIIISIRAMVLQRGRTTIVNDRKFSLLFLIVWYAIFSLGYFNSYSIMIRLPYSIAVLSPVVVKELFDHKQIKGNTDLLTYLSTVGIIIALAIIGIYENTAWLL